MSFGGSIKLQGESAYRKALKEITVNLKEVDSEIKAVTTQFDKNDKSQQALTSQSEVLTKKLELQAQKIGVLKNNYNDMVSTYEDNKKASADLSKQLETETQKLDAIEKASGKTSEEYQAQSKVVNDLNAEYKNSVNELDKQSQALSKTRTDINNAQASYNKTQQTINQLTEEEKKNEKATKELGNEIEQSGKKANDSANGGFTVLKGVLANLGADVVRGALTGLKNIGGALVDVGKQAISSYADFEQLQGGIETLFGSASQSVIENSQQAYKTVGMSANQYMEIATSFSASLVSSLNGDTAKAGAITDQALKDIADNSNKMGTDLSSVATAYQSFAKGQYTLLDNLKLGYGGTKGEMERLLADAEKISGVKYDISNLSDVYEAIHIIQGELGITGTTSKEASTTITGSVNQMKASWENLLTGIADDNSNFDGLINNFVDSILTVGDNLIPRIKTVVSGLGKLVTGLLEKLMPEILQEIPSLLETGIPIILSSLQSVLTSVMGILPEVISVISEWIPKIATSIVEFTPILIQSGIDLINQLTMGIISALPQLISLIPQTISDGVNLILENLPMILELGSQLLMSLVEGISVILPTLFDLIPEIVGKVADFVIQNLPLILESGIELITALTNGLIKATPQLLAMAPKLIYEVGKAIISNSPTILASGVEIVLALIKGIASNLTSVAEAGKSIFDTIKDKVKSLPDELKTTGKNLLQGLIGGIKEKMQDLKSQIKKIGETIVSDMKKALGIHSPSRKFKEIGKFTAQGFGIGFEDTMKMVSKDMINSVPTDFNVNPKVSTSIKTAQANEYNTMVRAFEEALTKVNVELDGQKMGKFVNSTVTDLVYN